MSKSLRGRKPLTNDFGTAGASPNYIPVNTAALNLIAGTSTRLPDTLTLCFQKTFFYPSDTTRTEPKKSSIWNPFKSIDKSEIDKSRTGSNSRRRHHSLSRGKSPMQSSTNGNSPESYSSGIPPSGSTDFEFRPCAKSSNGGAGGNSSNSSTTSRSKSPSAILGRFTNFARGKYRSSLHEKTLMNVQDDKQRRVRI